MAFEIGAVGIVGAGDMGLALAELTAVAGVPTTLVRARGLRAAAALDRIQAALAARVAAATLTAAGADAALRALTVTTDRDALAGAELVIEALVEDLVAKRELFADLDGRLAETAVLATSTATLRLAELAASIRDRRTIGLHVSPLASVSLVEIASMAATDADVVPAIERLVARLGRTAVSVQGATGSLANRLLVPLLLDAIHSVDLGLASAEQIDAVMHIGCGHPMGPLALADHLGLDVVYALAKALYVELRDARYRPPALLRRLVQAGHLGVRSGRGIYAYQPAYQPAAVT